MTNIIENSEITTIPIVIEIKGDRTQRFVDRNNPNFDKRLSELNKDYTQRGTLTIVTKIKPN